MRRTIPPNRVKIRNGEQADSMFQGIALLCGKAYNQGRKGSVSMIAEHMHHAVLYKQLGSSYEPSGQTSTERSCVQLARVGK